MQDKTSPSDFVFSQIERLTLSFPKTKLSAANISAYARALRFMNPDRLERAVTSAISMCKYFPSISEIIKAAEMPTPGQRIDATRKLAIERHIGMCDGMGEEEIQRYIQQEDIAFRYNEMEYFQNEIGRREHVRQLELRKQWPK